MVSKFDVCVYYRYMYTSNLHKGKVMNKDLTIANLKYPDTRKLEEYWKKRYNSSFHYKILGRMNTRNESALSDKIARIYKVSDNILHDIFDKHPSNTPNNIEYVFFKVKLLNDFYSTGIRDIYTVTEQLVKIDHIDELLKSGSFDAVENIRNLFKNDNIDKNDRDIYSFATKYCHFSNPKKYSIYDKYVGFLLADYIEKYKLYENPNIKQKHNELSKIEGNDLIKSIYEKIYNNKKIIKAEIRNSLRNYDLFMAYLNEFMEMCDLQGCKEQRAKIDNFLWIAGMMKYRKDSNVVDVYKK